ncbi:YlbL family protein [Rathayibacter soli]|uniref:YlbL family protein n=1 Tax=Rathayibacter soli TaxID=3144168 RepID=UPI0027E4D163|nr:PDZ domain-containing protein [Glaciibacter superstes]
MTLFSADDSESARVPQWQPAARPRMRRSVIVGWVLLAIAIVAVLVLGVSPAPYVIEQPGPVFNTLGYDQPVWPKQAAGSNPQRLISIPDTKTYPTSGSLDLLTVGVQGNPKQLPNWLDVIEAWFDPSMAVIPVDVAFPPSVSVDEQNQQNEQMMVDSQQDAIAAALNQLGYKFPQAVAVKQVISGTPAAGALKVGDEINTVNGTAIPGVQSLRSALAKNGAGNPAKLGITREGATQTVTVTPTDRDGAVILGIGAGMDYTFPINVKIQLNNVGGPSAGQMFALGIIDKLTPGALNDGQRVAGTGTIDNEGNVGAIGGIQQKMFGARAAGAQWFLAPASNCDEVTGHIPNGIRVFAVKTLKDSLTVLKTISEKGNIAGLPACPAK